jgi:hypothetical protein
MAEEAVLRTGKTVRMAQSSNSVGSRARMDALWASITALASGGTFSGPARRVAGYGSLNLYIHSNLSFRLRIEEACSETGPWTESHRETSVVNDAGTAQIIASRFTPTAEFARVFVDNLGGALQGSFGLCIGGLP